VTEEQLLRELTRLAKLAGDEANLGPFLHEHAHAVAALFGVSTYQVEKAASLPDRELARRLAPYLTRAKNRRAEQRCAAQRTHADTVRAALVAGGEIVAEGLRLPPGLLLDPALFFEAPLLRLTHPEFIFFLSDEALRPVRRELPPFPDLDALVSPTRLQFCWRGGLGRLSLRPARLGPTDTFLNLVFPNAPSPTPATPPASAVRARDFSPLARVLVDAVAGF
jgi:hypothetical protein